MLKSVLGILIVSIVMFAVSSPVMADMVTLWPTSWYTSSAAAWEDDENILGNDADFAKGVVDKTGRLGADVWDDWELPGGWTIDKVECSAQLRWFDSETTGSARLYRDLPTPITKTFAIVGGSWNWYAWDITSQEGDGWTEAEVDAVDMMVRRASSTVPDAPLRFQRLKLEVTYTPEPSTALLLLGGSAGLAVLGRRKRRVL